MAKKTIAEIMKYCKENPNSDLADIPAIEMLHDAFFAITPAEYLEKYLGSMDLTDKEKFRIASMFGIWCMVH